MIFYSYGKIVALLFQYIEIIEIITGRNLCLFLCCAQQKKDDHGL